MVLKWLFQIDFTYWDNDNISNKQDLFLNDNVDDLWLLWYSLLVACCWSSTNWGRWFDPMVVVCSWSSDDIFFLIINWCSMKE